MSVNGGLSWRWALVVALSATSASASGIADHGDDLFEREKVELKVSGYFRLRGDLLNNLDLDRGTTPSGQPLFPVPLGDPTGQSLFGSDMRLRTDVAIYAPFAAAAVKIRADLIDNLVLGSTPVLSPGAGNAPTPAASPGQFPATLLRIKRAYGEVPPLMFCAAGPARTPHVLVQVNLPVKEKKVVLAPPQPGTYGVFARGGARARLEVELNGPTEATLVYGRDGFRPSSATLAPWGTLHVVNESAEPRHVKIERQEYASNAVTAHYLTTVAEFRALFSKDLLKRGTPLKVSRVSLLFTDLTGSTALYASAGDAAAFRFVDDHFDVLRGAIAEAGGTVVKTMGDAVMAAFVDDETCARAAFGCLVAFDRFRKTTPHAEVTQLKLGIHGGPCYVVTANGTLDFFGQTVNVAARLQGLAESGEVVIEADALSRLPVEMRAGLTVSEAFQTRVKGVADPLTLVRMKL